MGFLVFRGTAEVTETEGDFMHGAIHGYVCVAFHSDIEGALQKANDKAKTAGLVIKTVDGDIVRVPVWRSWLPTEQGRELREARKHGAALTLCAAPGDPLREEDKRTAEPGG